MPSDHYKTDSGENGEKDAEVRRQETTREWPLYYLLGSRTEETTSIWIEIQGPNGPARRLLQGSDPEPISMHDVAMLATSHDALPQQYEDTPFRYHDGLVDGIVDAIVTNLEEIDAGVEDKNIGVRDARMKALLIALDEDEEARVAIGQTLQEALGRDVDEEFDRSDVVRLALRAGLQEAAPETWDQLKEASKRHAQQTI